MVSLFKFLLSNRTLQPGQQHEIEHYLNGNSTEMNSSFQGKVSSYSKLTSGSTVADSKRKDEEKRSLSRSKRDEPSAYYGTNSMLGSSTSNPQNSNSKETLEKSKLFSTLYSKPSNTKPTSPLKKAPSGMSSNGFAAAQKKETESNVIIKNLFFYKWILFFVSSPLRLEVQV